MKRSENVGLMLMGGAAFAATFAVGMTYSAWNKPSAAAQTQAMAVSGQTCATGPDGTRDCQPQRRSFAYYFLPHFVHGWWSGSASAPARRDAALVGSARPGATMTVSRTNVERAGFGSTARSTSIRVSAGG